MASELYTMNPMRRAKRRKSKTRARRNVRRTMPAAAPLPRRKRRINRRRVRRASARVATQFRRRRRSTKGVFGSSRSKKLSLSSFIEAAKSGAMNGMGAFATDIALGFVRPMLPTALGFGPARHLTRVGIGLALSHLTNRINPKFANAIAVGTATVAGYDFVKEYVQPMLPSGIVLGEYTNMGAYTQPGTLGYQTSGTVPQTMSGASEGAYYNTYN